MANINGTTHNNEEETNLRPALSPPPRSIDHIPTAAAHVDPHRPRRISTAKKVDVDSASAAAAAQATASSGVPIDTSARDVVADELDWPMDLQQESSAGSAATAAACESFASRAAGSGGRTCCCSRSRSCDRRLRMLSQFWSERVVNTFWMLPLLMVLVSAGLAIALVRVDELYGIGDANFSISFLFYSGGALGAREMLSSIASSALSVATTVFAITIASLTLATSQFGPRLLRNFVQDRIIQFYLGVFLSAFIYALIVLRSVRTDGEEGSGETEFVPVVSLLVALLSGFGCIVTLVLLVARIVSRIDIDTVIELISSDMRLQLDRIIDHGDPLSGNSSVSGIGARHLEKQPPTMRYQDQGAPPHLPDSYWLGSVQLVAYRGGFLSSVESEELAEWAAWHGVVFRMLIRPGDIVMAGVPIALMQSRGRGERILQQWESEKKKDAERNILGPAMKQQLHTDEDNERSDSSNSCSDSGKESRRRAKATHNKDADGVPIAASSSIASMQRNSSSSRPSSTAAVAGTSLRSTCNIPCITGGGSLHVLDVGPPVLPFPPRWLCDSAAQVLDRSLILANYRNDAKDVLLAIRQLVDVAMRALSAGINDPSTAIAVVDEFGMVLTQLAAKTIGTGVQSYTITRDMGAASGGGSSSSSSRDSKSNRVPVVIHACVDYSTLVDSMLSSIRHYGSTAPTVLHSLLHMLRCVIEAEHLPQRLEVLQTHVQLVAWHAKHEIEHPHDRKQLLRIAEECAQRASIRIQHFQSIGAARNNATTQRQHTGGQRS